MNIGIYNLSKNEENRILEIFQEFQQSFPNCELINRKDILGIGEQGKHLMCYFLYLNHTLLIKFKNKDEKLNIFDNSIYENINTTIGLFKRNQFLLKASSNQSSSCISKNSPYSNLSTDIIVKEFEKLLHNIDNKFNNISFDQCSNRLKNVLYKNGISNIQILKSYPIENILQFKNFGEKCLWELCEVLTKVSNNEIIETQSTSNKQNTTNDKQLEEQYNMLRYINNINNTPFVCDLKNAIPLYLENIDKYALMHLDLMEYLSKLSLYKLTPREQSIFNARFGINEEPKTLQEIGDNHSLTRERIRQIVLKIIRKLKVKKLSNIDFINLEYYKCKLFEKLNKLSFSGFIAYIFFECNNIEQFKLIYLLIFKKQVELKFVKNELERQYYKHQQKLIQDQKIKLYNDKIYNLIKYKEKRIISDIAYARLKTERVVNNTEENLISFSYNNEIYQCESFLEKKILEKFLLHKTFKQIKTQSLKIPFNNSYYYPDFQCLTHDNHLVIIEIKPLLNMCEDYQIKKFQALKNYCEHYGFGYLIVDDRNNSFFGINESNEIFNSLILKELNNNSKVKYNKYKEYYINANATIKNLLTLIKNENLKLSFPFLLTK